MIVPHSPSGYIEGPFFEYKIFSFQKKGDEMFDFAMNLQCATLCSAKPSLFCAELKEIRCSKRNMVKYAYRKRF